MKSNTPLLNRINRMIRTNTLPAGVRAAPEAEAVPVSAGPDHGGSPMLLGDASRDHREKDYAGHAGETATPSSIELCEECGEQRMRVGRLCIDCYYRMTDYPKCSHCNRLVLSCRCP